jgi:3-hydroxybutyryl-CoA dehydrogenase
MVLFVDTVGVVGAGTMGARIAEVFALNGKKVLLNDVKPEFIEKGRKSIRKSLDGLATFHESKAEREMAKIEKDYGIQLTDTQKNEIRAKRKPTYPKERVDEAYARIEAAHSVDALADCDLVIEAIVEDADAKHKLFTSLGKTVQSRAVLATNTSALPVSPMGEASGRPERVLGTHFFNPPTTLPLVEIIAGNATDSETVSDVMNLFSGMRNHRYPMMPIQVKECPGFLVNRILGAMLQEAFRCYEEKVASARDIDNAVKAGAGFPMGPLELSDLIGLDVLLHAQKAVEERLPEYGDYVAEPRVLEKLIAEGNLGRKTGKGFFEYG